MANLKDNPKDQKYRLAIVAAHPQRGEGMTGWNVALRIAQDRLTKKQIEASEPGKVQSAPMLAYNQYTTKDGKKDTSFTMPYSDAQYKKMLEASNQKGDKPVFEAEVFYRPCSANSKTQGYVVNTNKITPEPPKYKYDAAKDKQNTEAVKSIKDARRQAEAQSQAQAENQAQEAAQAEGLEAGA